MFNLIYLQEKDITNRYYQLISKYHKKLPNVNHIGGITVETTRFATPTFAFMLNLS